MAQDNLAAAEAAPHNIQGARLRVPPEIWRDICGRVDSKTIKSLRATCCFFSQVASLRLSRVFISPNPRNVETFGAIARHEVYRHQITEIVWDDAALYEGSAEDDYSDDASLSDHYPEDGDPLKRTREEMKWACDHEFGIDWTGNVPKWYNKACKTNIFDLVASCWPISSIQSSIWVDNDKMPRHPSIKQLASHMPAREA